MDISKTDCFPRFFPSIFLIGMLSIMLVGNYPVSIQIIKFEPKTSSIRIFSIWMYNNEAEAAYTNIWRLYNYVDYFLITVSNMTFSGLPKNITFSPFEKELEAYSDKIILAHLPGKVNGSVNSWNNEYGQRDYALKYMRDNLHPTPNDILLIGDVDEIYTREAVQYIRQNPPKTYYSVPGVMYFPYYFHQVERWNRNIVVRYSDSLSSLKQMRSISFSGRPLINNTQTFVTHCSYCFRTLQQYLNKLRSFSHQEYNKPPYTTPDWLFKSHYCRNKINSPPGFDEKDTNWTELIPNDNRLRFLYDPSYMYDINLTNYTTKNLENLCNRKFRRVPFTQ